jgi:hypothetical protein
VTDSEPGFFGNGHGAKQWARLIDLELHQDGGGRGVRSEEAAGDRSLTPLVEEVTEPDGSSLPDAQSVEMEHVLAVHPDIEVVEGLCRRVHDDQTTAVTEYLDLHHGSLAELLRIRSGRPGRVIYLPAASESDDHGEGENRRHRGVRQPALGRGSGHQDWSRGAFHAWTHGSGDLGVGVIRPIDEIGAPGATIGS